MEKNITKKEVYSLIRELILEQDSLTKKDIASWRKAHQMAINIENPKRAALYNIYDYTVALDSHVEGVVMRTKRGITQKKFRLVDKDGNEDREKTQLFETQWFKKFMKLALDANYWGNSLIELTNVQTVNDKQVFADVSLIPRNHVCPEFGVILKEAGDEPQKGIPYRENFPMSLVEAGEPKTLGAFLKICPQAISKKNAQIFWDNFTEKFGIPIIIATLTSSDKEQRSKAISALRDMGSSASGVFDNGIKIEPIQVNTQGGFEVFDRRILRAEEQISIALAGQTMVFQNGASLSQSKVHENGFEEVKFDMADDLKDLINDQLIPLMLLNGFPLEGYRFEWNDAYEFSPEQMFQIEQLAITNYEVDPKYITDKYGIPITGKKSPLLSNNLDFFA